MIEFEKIKIKKIEHLTKKEDVYDINVEDVHHYIIENGIVTHNTMDMFPQQIMKGGKGLYYASSVIAFLSKAKLKTGEEDELDIGQSGIIVTAKAMKNRMAKPKKVKFEIDFTQGSNPYKGLEAFCRAETFEQIGIAQGKWEEFKTPEVDKETGEVKNGIFKAGAGNRWYIRHLDKHIYTKELHKAKVFTPEVLDKMELVVNSYFKYKSMEELDEIQGEYETIEETEDDKVDGMDVDDVEATDLFE